MILIWTDDPATFRLCTTLVVLTAAHLAGDTVRLTLQRAKRRSMLHARRAA